MQLGVIGLGRMGANIVRRLTRAGHACVVYDRDPAPGKALAADGATAVESIAAMIGALAAPRTVWIMLPAGAATESTIELLRPLLKRGDCVIDGGNSFWRDDVRRGKSLAADGVDYIDVGVSGGVWGLERGFCMMIGGRRETFERLDPIFKALAPGLGAVERTPGRSGEPDTAEQGYLHLRTRLQLSLANILFEKGSFAQSKIPLEEALSIARAHHRTLLLVQAERLRASLLAADGDWPAAYVLFAETLKSATTLGLSLEIAGVQASWARAALNHSPASEQGRALIAAARDILVAHKALADLAALDALENPPKL